MTTPQDIQAEVDAQYQAKQDSLDRALATLKSSLGTTVGQQQSYGQIGDQSLQGIYGDLASKLQGIQGQTKDLYAGSADYLSKLFGNAQSQSQQATQGALGSLQDYASRLGLQAGLPGATGQIAASGQRNSQALNEAGTNALANLNQLGTGQQGVALQAIADSYKSGAISRKELVNQVLANITGAQNKYGAGVTDINNQIQDLGTQKAGDLKSALTQLQQRQEDQQFAKEQQQAGFAHDEAMARASAARAGSSSNPLNDLYKQLQIQALQNKLQPKGIDALNQWAYSANNGKGASQSIMDRIMNIISNTGQNLATKQYKGADPYTTAINYAKQKGTGSGGHSLYGELDAGSRMALIDALKAYYGE